MSFLTWSKQQPKIFWFLTALMILALVESIWMDIRHEAAQQRLSEEEGIFREKIKVLETIPCVQKELERLKVGR